MNKQIAFFIEQKKKELAEHQARHSAILASIHGPLTELNMIAGQIREITQSIGYFEAPDVPEPEDIEELEAELDATNPVPQPATLNREQRRKLVAEQKKKKKVHNGLSKETATGA